MELADLNEAQLIVRRGLIADDSPEAGIIEKLLIVKTMGREERKMEMKMEERKMEMEKRKMEKEMEERKREEERKMEMEREERKMEREYQLELARINSKKSEGIGK